MVVQARQWSKVSRFLFFVFSRCRLKFLDYSSSRLDGHRGHFHTVHTILFMHLGCIILFSQFCSNIFSSYGDVSNFEPIMATCSSFPSMAEHVANTW
jgi:hypothetical protein